MDKALDQLSGPWAGFWLQYGQRGFMRLELVFRSGSVAGTGEDRSGSFAMSGSYSGDQITLLKSYDAASVMLANAAPVLEYVGKWDGAVAYGRWLQQDNPWNSGEFEMWPVSGEVAVEEIVSERELVEARPLSVGSTFERG